MGGGTIEKTKRAPEKWTRTINENYRENKLYNLTDTVRQITLNLKKVTLFNRTEKLQTFREKITTNFSRRGSSSSETKFKHWLSENRVLKNW